MLNSFAFSNVNTNPLISTNNISSLSYLMDSLPSPIFCNEMENFDYLVSNDSPLNIQGDFNSSNLTDDSSIIEVENKIDSSKGGDEANNGVLEDGEMTHLIGCSRGNCTRKKKKKRCSNKDRHSKIRTAQGLRDRRMRLSLQVARSFFQLQDILGFDKASKTVEWLLIQSSTAIEELLQRMSHGSPKSVAYYCAAMSSTSDDCEVQSTANEIQGRKKSFKVKRSYAKDEGGRNKKRTTKEERNKARDRARQRTLEKLQRRRVLVDENNVAEHSNSSRKSSIIPPSSSLSYPQNYQVCLSEFAAPNNTIPTVANMAGGPQ